MRTHRLSSSPICGEGNNTITWVLLYFLTFYYILFIFLLSYTFYLHLSSRAPWTPSVRGTRPLFYLLYSWARELWRDEVYVIFLPSFVYLNYTSDVFLLLKTHSFLVVWGISCPLLVEFYNNYNTILNKYLHIFAQCNSICLVCLWDVDKVK